MAKLVSNGSALVGVLLAAACTASCASADGSGLEASGQVAQEALGAALPGTDATTFGVAAANFKATENEGDGLGPIFNAISCGTCHQNGALGGAGNQVERRYGTLKSGVFNALASTGGSLRQLFGIGSFTFNGVSCNPGTDANPAPGATIFAGRLTTPLFGLGLVDSLPDARFDTLASREPSSLRGIVNRVRVVLPNPADSSQSVGSTRVGRFGWKAGVPSLAQFAADAYLNEMGITTTHCSRGAVVSSFATENRANRSPSNALINGCPDDEKPGIDDDFAAENNNCAGVNALQDDVQNFTFFMAHLAPPPPQAFTAGSSPDRGRTLFNSSSLQCATCHRADPDVFVSTANGGVPAGVSFAPFSDFLLHDMGTLGDQIGSDGDSVATTRRMRTAPLWGIRSRNLKLHDGRTSDFATAISAHDAGPNGQGTPAGQAFKALPSAQKTDLINYLKTL